MERSLVQQEARQWAMAAGYLSIFIVPALLVIGAVASLPWLAFGAVVVVFPLLRVVFGAISSPPPEWGERVATALDKLPLLYPPVYAVSILFSVHATAAHEPTITTWAGFALSLWMTSLFATCVAHELIHRRSAAEAGLGHLLAGACGYPLLGPEHLGHHAHPGNVVQAETPGLNEGLWAFAGRRLLRIAREFDRSAVFMRPGRAASSSQKRLRRAMAATLIVALTFLLLAGAQGLLVYTATALGVAFGVQVITYIQHWGLGADSLGQGVQFGRGWDDDCQFQAWVTLNISLHDEHHRQPRLPYYRVDLAPSSPRLPAGYVVLMFVSLVPPLWFRLLTPSLDRWLTEPRAPASAGRRITCFGVQ